jgi:hypothetical protein
MAKGTLVTGITSSGQSVISTADAGDAHEVIIQNVGTVPIAVYFNADGSGDPMFQLGAGQANDDGNGDVFTDYHWKGPVSIKAPAGGGRALVSQI